VVVLETPTKSRSHITFLALGRKYTPPPLPLTADETSKYNLKDVNENY
jgi:hypothetical protein